MILSSNDLLYILFKHDETSLTMQLVETALLIGYPVLCAFSQEFLAGAHNFDVLSKRRYAVNFRGAQSDGDAYKTRCADG